MALRYNGHEAPYEKPMCLSERSTCLSQERLYHRLIKRGGGMGLCSCGKAYPGADEKNIYWRHELHVNECIKQLEDRLDGKLD